MEKDEVFILLYYKYIKLNFTMFRKKKNRNYIVNLITDL